MNMTKMEYANKVAEVLKELGVDVNSVDTVKKTNDTVFTGIRVNTGTNTMPMYYIDASYENDLAPEIAARNIKKLFDEHADEMPVFNVDDIFSDFEAVKSRIIACVVNGEKNNDNDFVKVKLGNLAAIFKVVIPCGAETGTVTISKNFLDSWGVTAEDIIEAAKANVPNFSCRSMFEVLLGFGYPEEMFGSDDDTPGGMPPMYVITTDNQTYGASALFYNDIIKDFAEKKNSDVVIIPSSIHELIVIPVDDSTDSESILAIVKEVNQTQVTAEEFLSDDVYFYTRSKGYITSYVLGEDVKVA